MKTLQESILGPDLIKKAGNMDVVKDILRYFKTLPPPTEKRKDNPGGFSYVWKDAEQVKHICSMRGMYQFAKDMSKKYGDTEIGFMNYNWGKDPEEVEALPICGICYQLEDRFRVSRVLFFERDKNIGILVKFWNIPVFFRDKDPFMMIETCYDPVWEMRDMVDFASRYSSLKYPRIVSSNSMPMVKQLYNELKKL